MDKLKEVIRKLTSGEPLSALQRDHALKGEWKGCRECHVEGDWILIYSFDVHESGHEMIVFRATDNHSNLFG